MKGPSKDDAKVALESVETGVGCLDRGDLSAAGAEVDRALELLTANLDAAWLESSVGDLLAVMKHPDSGRALARALWLGTTVDELSSRTDRARLRCLRAMELYARLRGTSDALDMRAARELGSASARLGATHFAAAHGRR